MIRIYVCVKSTDGRFKVGEHYVAVALNNGVQVCYANAEDDTKIMLFENNEDYKISARDVEMEECAYSIFGKKENIKFVGEEMAKIEKDRLIDKMSLIEMGIGVRAYNCLRRANCKIVGDVKELARQGKLIYVRNLGQRSLDIVVERLEELYGETMSIQY